MAFMSFALTFRFWSHYLERLYLGVINIAGGFTQLERDTHRTPCQNISIIYIDIIYLTENGDAFQEARQNIWSFYKEQNMEKN